MRTKLSVIVSIFVMILILPVFSAAEQEQPTSITIAYSGTPQANIFNALLENYGFFEKNGLVVTPFYYQGAEQTAERVVSGERDFGMVSTYAVASILNDGKNPVILASVMRIDEIYYITVNQKAGILSPGDLKGKRIGLMPSDSWEYFLDKYLILNGEDISSVTLVPLADEETVIAKLKTGEIDAGLTIYQYASFLTTSKPDTYQMWSVNNFENNYMLLISNKEMVQKNPDAVKKLLKAFIETWDYYNANTKKVQEEFGGDSGLSVKQMEDLVSGLTPEVSLTQGLLNTLEAQSRYLLDIGSGTITNTPNYLEIIDFSFLHDIEPKKCTIIH